MFVRFSSAHLLPLLGGLLQLEAKLLLLVAEFCGLFEMLLADGLFLLRADLVDLLAQSLEVGRRLSVVMRARAPDSSITSIALSGRKRPVM